MLGLLFTIPEAQLEHTMGMIQLDIRVRLSALRLFQLKLTEKL